MTRDRYESWVDVGQRVDATYAAGPGTHGTGTVIAYTDRPTLTIRGDDGKTFTWIADLCKPADPELTTPEPDTVKVHCANCGRELLIARAGITACPCGVGHTVVASRGET